MNMFRKMLCTALGVAALAGAAQGAGKVVISQVYGGGGNSGAQYKNDFIELFNSGDAPVAIGGWSVQYAGATGSSWQKTDIPAFTLQPGQYFLIQEAQGTGGTLNLPAPDVTTGVIPMSATAGKVALVNSGTPLTVSNPVGASGVIDFVGFGTTANAFEGSGPTPAPSNTTAVLRNSNGCADTDNNAANFTAAAPTPRNSASPFNLCTPSVVNPSGTASTAPTNACPGTQITVTVNTIPGSPAPSGIVSVTGDFTSVGGFMGTVFTETAPGSNVWTAMVTVDVNTPTGAKSFPITITDASSRVGTTSASFTVNNCLLRLTTGTGLSPATVCAGSQETFTAVVAKGQIGTTSTGVAVTLDLAPLGGNNGVAMSDQGDDPADPTRRIFTYTYTVPASTPAGGATITANISDAQFRSATGTFNVRVANCVNATSTVVISQFYGGGGNTGATYQNDFVELFNRTSTPQDISGWSLWYANASTGNFSQSVAIPAGTVLQPGQHYLITLAAGNSCNNAPCGVVLPVTGDLTGTINMGGTDGRIILISGTAPAAGLGDIGCPPVAPAGVTIQDYVGYGNATCQEGIGAAPAVSATTAGIRASNGCQDYNQNGVDFSAGTPAPRNLASTATPCGTVTPTGACCLAGNDCQIRTQANCLGGVYQGNNTTCTPTNPCAPAVVICCRGATCTSVAAGSCTTTGTTQAGAFSPGTGSACNIAGNERQPCCKADYNKVGGVELLDIFAFLNDWFGNVPYADFNQQNGVDLLDIFAFLNAWFAGGC